MFFLSLSLFPVKRQLGGIKNFLKTLSHACLCENTEIESEGKKEKKREEMKLLLLESALICQAVTKN